MESSPRTAQRDVPSRKARAYGPIAICGQMVDSAILTGEAARFAAFNSKKTTGMKILQIARQYLPSTGGVESSVDGLSHALQDAGHIVSIVTLKKIFGTGEVAPTKSVVNGLNVTRIGHWGSRRYPVAPSVLSHVNGSDLLHIH